MSTGEAGCTPSPLREARQRLRRGAQRQQGSAQRHDECSYKPKQEPQRRNERAKARHLYRAVKLVERYHDRFPWSDFITRLYGLDEANEALADVEELKVVKAVIKL